MKLLFTLILVYTSTFALTINDSLLKIHATLLPKIYLMDYKYSNKFIDNSIVIAIAYNKREYKNALSLKNKIDTKYHHNIKNHNIKTKIVLYKNIKRTKANIYYLLPAKKRDILNTIETARKNDALTFSYLKDDLKYGVMLSVVIGEKVQPIINIDAIKMEHINLRPILLKISTIYKQSSDRLLLNYNPSTTPSLITLDKIKNSKLES